MYESNNAMRKNTYQRKPRKTDPLPTTQLRVGELDELADVARRMAARGLIRFAPGASSPVHRRKEASNINQ